MEDDNELPDQVTVENLSHTPLAEKLLSQTVNLLGGIIQVHPYQQVFPGTMRRYLKLIRDFKVREDDVWIASFPKCGTTWTQEMVWCIMNDVDLQRANDEYLHHRVPFFEMAALHPKTGDSFDQVEELESPRIIKTHLLYDMLPKECEEKKIIYVARNPRDVCVSFHNHFKILEGYTGSFEEFVEYFLSDKCIYYSPFFTHVLSYWNQKNLPNILFLFYEEMIDNLPLVVRRVAQHLGKNVSNDDVERLVNHLSFDNMKKNPKVNYKESVDVLNTIFNKKFGLNNELSRMEFIRKGKMGDWKEHIKGDLLVKFKLWERKGLCNSDLKFTFDSKL